MAFDPKGPALHMFRDALKHPDGIAAYVIAGMCVILMLVALLPSSALPNIEIIARLRSDVLILVLMPFVMLVSYAWLNSSMRDSPVYHWVNTGLIVLVTAVFLWRTLFG